MWRIGILLLAAAIACVSGTSVDVTVTPNGDGKFVAVVAVTPTEQVNGWEVVITFSSPITAIDVSSCFTHVCLSGVWYFGHVYKTKRYVCDIDATYIVSWLMFPHTFLSHVVRAPHFVSGMGGR